jgi:hypothetical protein
MSRTEIAIPSSHIYKCNSITLFDEMTVKVVVYEVDLQFGK